MGPLISAAQREAVGSFLDDGGAGGVPRVRAPRAPGSGLLPPCSRRPSRPTARSREEIFGPIVAVVPFADEEEAIELANDTIYGLSGLDLDPRRGARAARRAGASRRACCRSTPTPRCASTTPFGGFKQSGYGRELGPHALDAYTEVKTIFYATGEAS